MEASLIVVKGKASKSRIELKLPTIIGRSRDITLTIAHPMVSRQHCELYEADGMLMIRDLGSLNGTFVEGERIKEAPLPPETEFTVGPLTFRADYTYTGDTVRLPSLVPAVPVAESPVVESPVAVSPVDDSSLLGSFAKEAPIKEVPAVDAPVEDAPSVDAPADDFPVADSPAVEAADEDFPVADFPVVEGADDDFPVADFPAPAADSPAGDSNPLDFLAFAEAPAAAVQEETEPEPPPAPAVEEAAPAPAKPKAAKKSAASKPPKAAPEPQLSREPINADAVFDDFLDGLK